MTSDAGWGKPVFGAGVLRYPQIMSPNFNLANPSASPANSWALLQSGLAYIFGLVLSGGTITGPDYIINSSGFFIYSGTPANGNLIGSWAGAAGTDAFGNAYPQGINVTQGTIAGSAINAGTIDNTRLGPNAVTAANVAANQFGLNMVSDPQFSQSALNTIRAADAFSTGSWTFSANTAICAATTGGARLALMPSTVPPMWVVPGEQYYVACTFTTTAASSTLFVTIATDGGNAQISQSGVAAGTHTVSGIVTIPSGAHTGYFRFSSINASSNATTASNPVCQPAALFSPTITGTNYIINTNGIFEYSGTPALGNLVASVTQADGTDSFGNTYYTGFCSYVASGGATPTLIGQFNAGAASFGNSSAFGGSATQAPGAIGPVSQGHLAIDSGSNGTGSDAFLDLICKDDNATQAAGTVVAQGVLAVNSPDMPATGVAGNTGLYQDVTTDQLYAITSSNFIGEVAIIGRDFNHTATINSASFSNILSVAVQANKTYKFDMALFLSAAHSAGQWQIQVAGPTFSFLQYAFKWTSAAGVTGLNVNRTTLSATQAGPNPSVAGAYWSEVHGYITTTVSGHIVIKAASSTGATDTWTYYENSTLEVQEISF